MGKIVVTEFVSVDGVSDDPSGVEGFERGGWSFALGSDGERVRLRGKEGEELLLAENRVAAALLVGRKTYEFLAGFFPQQEGRPLADVINRMRKYIVSSTLENAEWNNSTVLSGEVTEEVGRLKREIDGEILVPGSTQLVQTLIEQGLVDELRLMVHPVVVGAGKRLFGDTSAERPLRLVGSKQVGEGVVILTYEPALAGARRVRPGSHTARDRRASIDRDDPPTFEDAGAGGSAAGGRRAQGGGAARGGE